MRVCADCVHFERDRWGDHHHCGRIRNHVSGDPVFAENAREFAHLCGIGARFFEPSKPVTIFPPGDGMPVIMSAAEHGSWTPVVVMGGAVIVPILSVLFLVLIGVSP